MISAVREKINKIPEKFRCFIVSEKATDFSVEICDSHKIDSSELRKKFFNILLSVFLKETRLSDLVNVLQKEFSFSTSDARSLALDIAGKRLLVVKDWFDDDVTAFIKTLGGKVEDYIKYVEENKKAIEDERVIYEKLEKGDTGEEISPVPTIEDVDKIEIKVKNEFDLNNEKVDSERNFKEHLSVFLDEENGEITSYYNDVLLQILLDGGLAAKVDLEKALYANQEKITTSQFIMDGKVSVGTIANWIKHFIAVKGSDMFDNIIVSSFLVQSPNAKTLSTEEKSVVRKLLLLYRNLKFFPKSMPNQTGDGWEIIPINLEEEAQRTKIIPNVELPTIDSKLKELEDRLTKVADGSLQRRAIEEEIKKLKNKK